VPSGGGFERARDAYTRFGGVRTGPAPGPETGKPAPGLAGASAWTRLLPAPTGTRRGLLPDHVRRSAGPEFGSDPANRGISALSTETICGPKLSPPRWPPPRSRQERLASSQVSGGGGGI